MTMPTAGEMAAFIMSEIEKDIAASVVANDVTSFSEVQDWVDANEYVLAAGRHFKINVTTFLDLVNDSTAIVDNLLRARHVGYQNVCAACGQGYDGGHVCDFDPDLDPNLDQEVQVMVPEVHFHRNGVTGEPFYLVSFITFDDEAMARPLVAVVTSSLCAVITPDNIKERWRGDHFESEIRAAVATWEDNRKDSNE